MLPRVLVCSFLAFAATGACLAFAATGAWAANIVDRTNEALGQINVYRARHGLAPLRMEARLALSARDQAADMMAHRYFDTRSPTGLTLEKRLRQAGYAYREATQQIALGYPDGKSVVESWIKRGDSRRDLLSRSLSEAGIGYARRGDTAASAVLDHYWVITLAEPTRPAARNWRRQILRFVNEFRQRHDLAPLKPDPRLNRAAQAHSDDMAARDYFGHVTPGGRTVGDRATQAGYDWRRVLENLGAGQDRPSEVVAGWIGSPPHRRAMLARDVADAGVGYAFLARDGGQIRSYHYWTLDLGQRR